MTRWPIATAGTRPFRMWSGSVVALVANIVFGAFSDLTRSKWGKRTLWIISGAFLIMQIRGIK